MDDLDSDGLTHESGEIEITIRNKRTGLIKHQETLKVEELKKWQ